MSTCFVGPYSQKLSLPSRYYKGKTWMATPIEDALPSGDESLTDEEVILPRKYAILMSQQVLFTFLYHKRVSKHRISSKFQSAKGARTVRPAVVLNSFEVALAKKGITVEKALEKQAIGSPSKQVYLADLNSNHVL